MNPVEYKQGQSFKGLASYLLHDERREGEEARTTAERVGSVESFNLNGADGQQAWKLMAATANSAADLKAAAGIKKGRAVKNTVFHYSLNFNPQDNVTPAIRQAAVKGSLAVLGLQDHQALAVEHTDKAHNHVHVMVNLIDPNNGMSAATPQMGDDGKKRSKLSNSQRRLSAFAAKFERDHRLTITDGRLENANRRMKGERVDAKRSPRNVRDRQKQERVTDDKQQFERQKFEGQATVIHQDTAQMKDRHSAQWKALKAAYAHEKDAIRANQPPAMKARADEIKNAYKPVWRDLFQRQRAEMESLRASQRSMLGRVFLAAETAGQMIREQASPIRIAARAFNAGEQRARLEAQHDSERTMLGREVRRVTEAAMIETRQTFKQQFQHSRARFLGDSAELKGQQDRAWATIRERWSALNVARRNAFAVRPKQQATQQRNQGRGRSRGRGMSPS